CWPGAQETSHCPPKIRCTPGRFQSASAKRRSVPRGTVAQSEDMSIGVILNRLDEAPCFRAAAGLHAGYGDDLTDLPIRGAQSLTGVVSRVTALAADVFGFACLLVFHREPGNGVRIDPVNFGEHAGHAP